MFPDPFRDDVFTLETQRLFLRWPKAGDIATLVNEAGDRRVAEQHATIPHPYAEKDAIAFVMQAREANEAGHSVYLAITERRTPEKLIGVVSLRRRPNGDVSIGYWLGVRHWGQGYATEAAQALVDAAFLYSPVNALIAQVRVTNPASTKVLEKCGFQFEGNGMCARPAFSDCVPAVDYRITRTLWASLKGWRAPLPTFREPLGCREAAPAA